MNLKCIEVGDMTEQGEQAAIHSNWSPKTGPESMVLDTATLNSIVRELLWSIQTDEKTKWAYENVPMFHKAYTILEQSLLNYDPLPTKAISGIITSMALLLGEHQKQANKILNFSMEQGE
jgi:hypothetical protein